MLRKVLAVCCLILASNLVSGCAGTQSRSEQNPDPLETPNRAFFTLNETLDKRLLRPVASTYADLAPQPFRELITNFFANINYLNVILNSFLQGKLKQGVSDSMRFMLNSTIGIGGLVDVATSVGLPAHREDFGQTLAAWGLNQGAYLYLPLRGPNTVRNLPDLGSSYLLNPITYISGAILFPVTALNIINERANLLEATDFIDEAAVDPYSFTREAYLQQRQFLIHDGSPPSEDYDDLFDEDEASEDAPVLIID